MTRPQRMPWETDPEPTTEEKLERLRKDVSAMVACTCALVRSSHEDLHGLRMNVPRGTVPKGQSFYKDGTTLEIVDLGMPQPQTPFGAITDLLAIIADAAKEAGLEL